MKKFLTMLGMTAGLFALAGTAMAANPGTFTLRVTPDPASYIKSVSVSTSAASVDFGTLAMSSTGAVTAASTTVTNAGNIVSDYALRINPVGGTTWTSAGFGGVPGADTYRLRALFNGNTVPSNLVFLGAGGGTQDDMSTASNPSSVTAYSNGVETGLAVVPNAKRGLWFMLDMPTSSSVTGQQSVNVEILAQ